MEVGARKGPCPEEKGRKGLYPFDLSRLTVFREGLVSDYLQWFNLPSCCLADEVGQSKDRAYEYSTHAYPSSRNVYPYEDKKSYSDQDDWLLAVS